MNCHRCKWNRTPPSDEKLRACLDCNPDADDKRGRSFVSTDTPGGRRMADAAAADGGNPLDDILPRCCQETATRLIQFFRDVPASRRDLVVRRLGGESFASIARSRHVSRQRVDGIWRDLEKRLPELKALSSRLP